MSDYTFTVVVNTTLSGVKTMTGTHVECQHWFIDNGLLWAVTHGWAEVRVYAPADINLPPWCRRDNHMKGDAALRYVMG